jgi:hypothetical protein
MQPGTGGGRLHAQLARDVARAARDPLAGVGGRGPFDHGRGLGHRRRFDARRLERKHADSRRSYLEKFQRVGSLGQPAIDVLLTSAIRFSAGARNQPILVGVFRLDGRAEPPFCFPHAPVQFDPRFPQTAGHFFFWRPPSTAGRRHPWQGRNPKSHLAFDPGSLRLWRGPIGSRTLVGS